MAVAVAPAAPAKRLRRVKLFIASPTLSLKNFPFDSTLARLDKSVTLGGSGQQVMVRPRALVIERTLLITQNLCTSQTRRRHFQNDGQHVRSCLSGYLT